MINVSQVSFDQLIQMFNAGRIGTNEANQLAEKGYHLEFDKAHNVTAIVKNEN